MNSLKTGNKSKILSPTELEKENERLLDETAKLESDIVRWEAACKRAASPFGSTARQIVEIDVSSMMPAENIEVNFKIDDNIVTFEEPKHE